MIEGVTYSDENRPDFTFDPSQRDTFAALLATDYHFPIDPTITRDFDNGTGNYPDGPYINKPDDGSDELLDDGLEEHVRYFSDNKIYYDDDPDNFNPHRMVPSPVAFGSLPSAVQANAPWTCLLFRPNISDPQSHPHLGEAGNGLRYLGDRTTADDFAVPQFVSVAGDPSLPADHHWLDLFWMPAVQPEHLVSDYATAGKVNLNYEMMPFPYIKRATVLHAVLKSEQILCLPTEAGEVYKGAAIQSSNWRKGIDSTETLKAFEARFASAEHFLTESEICEHFLIPAGESWDEDGAAMRAFWDRHRLSGDIGCCERLLWTPIFRRESRGTPTH